MAARPERHRSFLAAPRGILKILSFPHPFRGRNSLFSPLSVASCQSAFHSGMCGARAVKLVSLVYKIST